MDDYVADGFENERLIVIPEKIKKNHFADALIKRLHITDLGYFPKAHHHRRDRPDGSGEHICIYCNKGSGWIYVNGVKTIVRENELHIIPTGTPHSYGASENDPWSIYWFHFNGDDAGCYFQEMESDFLKSRLSEEKELVFIELFDRIYLSLEKGYNKGNLIIVSNLFSYLLSILFFSGFEHEGQSEKAAGIVERSINHMQKNLQKTLSLKDLASHVNYSIPHYSSLFKMKTGHSPLNYFQQLKIQRACLLLDTTADNIGEISRKLGYEDPYYFSRVFSRIMGCSPRNYRKIKKG